MSGGPSAPSNLLVQRLDTALGITLAKHGTLVRGQPATFAPHIDRNDPATAVGQRQDQSAREATRQPAAEQTRQTRLTAQRGLDLAALSKLFPSSPTSLGQAAQTILSVLQQYPQTQLPPQPQLRAPLWSNAPGAGANAVPQTGSPAAAQTSFVRAASTEPTATGTRMAPSPAPANAPTVMQLALALARSVTQSGLFYESQLARVTYGQQPIARVHAQPQAHLQMPETAHTPARNASPSSWTNLLTPSTSQTTAGHTTPAPSGLQPGSHAGQALQTGAPPLPPEVTLIVRQQLDILAQQSVMFQGEAWPGAPMEWEIERRPGQEGQPDTAASAEEVADHWQSRLTLHLPQLGTINADFLLQNGHWSLRLTSQEHTETLQQQAARLQNRFKASGLVLHDLQIAPLDDDHEPG